MAKLFALLLIVGVAGVSVFEALAAVHSSSPPGMSFRFGTTEADAHNAQDNYGYWTDSQTGEHTVELVGLLCCEILCSTPPSDGWTETRYAVDLKVFSGSNFEVITAAHNSGPMTSDGSCCDPGSPACCQDLIGGYVSPSNVPTSIEMTVTIKCGCCGVHPQGYMYANGEEVGDEEAVIVVTSADGEII